MMQIDERDLQIIRILQIDAKTTAREISNRLQCPITTVYSRIKKLEDSGVIMGYKPVLDSKKMGKPTTAFILASVAYRTPGDEEPLDQRKISQKVALFPEVQEVHITTGDWDLIIKVKERDVASVGRFVVDKLRTVKGIEKTLTSMVFETTKETLDISL